MNVSRMMASALLPACHVGSDELNILIKNVLCIQSTFTLVTGPSDVNEILKRVYPLPRPRDISASINTRTLGGIIRAPGVMTFTGSGAGRHSGNSSTSVPFLR